MKKLFSVFIIIVILVSVTCVVLSYQNSGLNNQIGVLEDNLSECQNQSIEYENEISVLENQIFELERQIDELENQNFGLQSLCDQLTRLSTINNSSIKIKVTDFTIPGFLPTVGTWVESDANITVQNLGTNDLEGLTLTIAHPDDYPSGGIPTSPVELGSLDAGEERTVSTHVFWELSTGIKFVIRIKLDDIILHEYRTY